MHSPGPWKIEPATSGFRAPCEDGAKDMQIVAADGMCPGVIWDGVIGDTQTANAKVIAAAPDLLEVCRKILADDEQVELLSDETLAALGAAVKRATPDPIKVRT